MSKTPTVQLYIDFRVLLLELHDFKNREYDLVHLNHLLRKSLLDFGSETPDNVAAAKQIEYGISTQKKWGLKLTAHPELFKDYIQSLLKDTGAFFQTQSVFSDLSKEEWEASLSFAFLLLQDLTHPFGLVFRMKEIYYNGKEERLNAQILEKINSQTAYLIQNSSNLISNQVEPNFFKYLEFNIDENFEGHIKRWGIKVKDYFFLSDLFSVLESDVKIPETLKSKFSLNQQEWKAFNRFMVLLFLAFEGNQRI